ncbi:hypothetical protein BDP81DRAFT_396955 [Colletotrichum phormii]|uniref:Cyclin-dependent kinase protein n=1 Tax=Colletotrichum phormii TaxID=359342 RepID=A0AAI9ZKX3_9PEZI|nr:uncharacterized protein BDP81DRAFT_396955 [Colletotrichum phormii]KAK1633576.1 hypothetical protein BDP81DRAFT_396955 [Colletotrichum phormii]
MDPSSPAKRRALAPLDANVNAISSPTKLHKHSKVGAGPQSPRKSQSPIKALNLKRSIAAVDIFDENALVPKKKHCQEPASATATATATATDADADATTAAAPLVSAAPVVAPAPARELALAPEATSSVPAIASASATAPTEMEMDVEPDAMESQNEQLEEQKQHSEQQPEPEVQGEDELPERQEESRHETPRTRSASPDTSAVFDTSAMDTSQNTTILTEPDAEQARTLPPPRPRRLLTREEARQKARILRLKLGLANYKLQTGQENVPLDKLQVKPRPGQQQQQQETKTQTQTTERALPRVMVQPPSSRDGPPENEAEEVVEETEPEQEQETDEAESATPTQQVQEEKEPRSVVGVLPRLEMDDLKAGRGNNNDEEPTSAVSGGIVSSLLSLARGPSSPVSTSS